MVQRHEYSVELNAPPEEVWEVFWYRAPDRPQPKDVKTRIEILHPGDDVGNGLVRHCYFPVPRWLLSRGVGQWSPSGGLRGRSQQDRILTQIASSSYRVAYRAASASPAALDTP